MAKNVSLKIIGSREMLVESIRQRAEQDLGFPVEFEILDGIKAVQRAVTAPETFAIYDNWHAVDLVWTARTIQPIDIRKIELWSDLSRLTKKGRLTADSNIGQGAAPVRSLYVQADDALGSKPTDYVSILPTVHNVDAFGYSDDLLDFVEQGEQESWAWLLDERWHGKAALAGDPVVGAIDAALAIKASGLRKFNDLGNLSIAEIDALIGILGHKKKSGHFRAFWGSGEECTNLFKSKRVMISSLWSPTLTQLRAQGGRVTSAAPKEGYRGWHSGLCLSRAVSGRALDMAYEFLNWYLAGFPGAVMARQGYYMSVLDRTRKHLSQAEWDYWYGGEAASSDLGDSDGHTIVKKGEIRDGGAYETRMSKVAVWNSFMDEHNYLVRRWSELIKS